MAKVALHSSGLGGTGTRAASVLLITGLLLAFTVMAGAQDPQPKKKVAVVKPDDKKTDDKKTDTKTDPKPEPKPAPKPEPKPEPEPAATETTKTTGFASIEEPTRLINEYLA